MNAHPVEFACYHPPAIKALNCCELKWLTSLGVHSALWMGCTNKDVRICGDFKVTVNQCIDIEQYSLPKIINLYVKLLRGQKFTTLDLSEAFLQMELEESQRYLVVNTHWGLFRYKRLLFGVSSNLALFQRVMNTILQGLPRVLCYQDYILSLEAIQKNISWTLNTFLQKWKLLAFVFIWLNANLVEYLGHMI